MKKIIEKGNHIYEKVTKSDVNEIINALEPLAQFQDKTGNFSVQNIRELKDTIIGNIFKVDYINKDNNGPDGLNSKTGKYYENKNTSIKTKGGLKVEFKDTSEEKLKKLEEGIPTTVTAWKNVSHPAYALVGNTRMIWDLLEKSYDKKNRKTCSVSAKDAIARGFKMVALEYSPSETYANAYMNQKRGFKNFDPASICTVKDIKAITEEINK